MPIWKLTHRNIPLNSLPKILALRRRKEQFLYMLLSVSEHGYAKINVRGKRQYYDVEEYAVMEKGAIDLTVTLDLERYKAWRRVVVPGDATFVQLHKIIQCVFSWQDRHPYQFDINGISIVDPHIADVDGVFLASEQRLKDVSLPWQAQMLYTYDFRSKWIHLLNVNGVLKEYEGGPKLIAGEGDAPPEDIGSIEEYLDFLDIIDDPRHPQHKFYLHWLEKQIWRRLYDAAYIQHELDQLK